MTDRAQFEAMLEALINDDTDQAKEIFHNIVVSKSREIYEELLAEDFSKDTGNPYGKDDEEMDEDGEGEPEPEAPMEGEDEEEPADDADDEEGEDDGEDMPFGDEEGEDDMGGEGDIEDRVMDLEDALEDLKAEFEQLLSQEDEEGGHDMDAIHDAGDDMGGMDAEMDEADMQPMMEYYKKVSVTHGDNGTNTKSTIDNMKNDMGGTTANIAKNFSTTKGGTEGGLASPKTGDLTSGLGTVHNRVNSNAGKTAFKKQEPGHGAEKKGAKPGQMAGARTGELGGQRGEQSKQSLLKQAKR